MIPGRPSAPAELPSPPKRAPWLRVGLPIGLALVIGIVVWFSPLRELLHPGRITAWLRSAGGSWWTPFAFLGLYVIFSLTFIPVFPLAVAGVLIWGWFWGGMLELLVATIASVPPYLIARSTASGWIEAKMRQRFGVNYDRVRIQATSTLFLLRLVPVLPFSALNYLAGLAAIRPIPYVVASGLGMIPSVFIFTYFVDAIVSGAFSMREASTRVLIGGALLAVLFILSRWVAAKLHGSMRR